MQKNSYEYLNASNPFSPKFLQERNLIIDTKYKTIRTSVRMFEEKVYKIHLISLFYAKLKEVGRSIFHNQPREKIHRSVNRTFIYICVCIKREFNEKKRRGRRRKAEDPSREIVSRKYTYTRTDDLSIDATRTDIERDSWLPRTMEIIRPMLLCPEWP